MIDLKNEDYSEHVKSISHITENELMKKQILSLYAEIDEFGEGEFNPNLPEVAKRKRENEDIILAERDHMRKVE